MQTDEILWNSTLPRNPRADSFIKSPRKENTRRRINPGLQTQRKGCFEGGRGLIRLKHGDVRTLPAADVMFYCFTFGLRKGRGRLIASTTPPRALNQETAAPSARPPPSYKDIRRHLTHVALRSKGTIKRRLLKQHGVSF